ncbi:hypothetical protein [Devosia sp. 919]|uniref:hypothetical protein n=1 Tax=Devosia sp. 919 TaxID=2726065 RepID=UPI001555650D|nr:hypothetical protein [Devosia sp. 919]
MTDGGADLEKQVLDHVDNQRATALFGLEQPKVQVLNKMYRTPRDQAPIDVDASKGRDDGDARALRDQLRPAALVAQPRLPAER